MILAATNWAARRAVVQGGSLAPLAASLADDLHRLLPDEEIFVPVEKAMLTRRGGRCEHDGLLLEFDPRTPRRHACAGCGRVYAREEDYRWWIMGYQLWLAERAVHAGLLARLNESAPDERLASAILRALCARYLSYPNEDNVLGPGRVFFSTYLESIWLLQVCVAVSLLEDGTDRATGAAVRDRIVLPSARVIAEFNEGDSNRQVWNAAALAAAGMLLDRPALVAAALEGPGGLLQHLRHGLLDDGTWYEGENYHHFAHRGLWYLVMVADRVGLSIPDPLVRRYQRAFVAPLLTALPDFTFPSRRDSQYKVSLRQWRFAESLELGLARGPDDPMLAAGLRNTYGHGPARAGERWRSTAEAERNAPGRCLTRADLGWKSLWFARGEVPAGAPSSPPSVILRDQGLAVVRRDDARIYVALDYGHGGGGHGHPDRLNLWLVNGDERVLEDVGTGSYVDPSLHWYRSTLAHNAPMVNGRTQDPVRGRLRAWGVRREFRWIDAEAELSPGVRVRRSIVVAPDYLVDRVAWEADGLVRLDLPVHVDAATPGADWQVRELPAGLTDPGFQHVVRSEHSSGGVTRLETQGATGWVRSGLPLDWWRLVAPGPPGEPARPFHLVRASAARGAVTSVWSWAGQVADVELDGDEVVVRRNDGTEHRHREAGGCWQVTGATTEPLEIDGREPAVTPEPAPSPRPRPVRPLRPLTGRTPSLGDLTSRRVGRGRDQALRFELGARVYRRSEQPWSSAGRPTATVVIAATAAELVVEVTVAKQSPWFAPPVSENPLDNEHPDTNSDGVQLQVRSLASPPVRGSWILVPEPGSDRVRQATTSPIPLVATWRLTRTGYQVLARIGLDDVGHAFDLGVIVNEKPASRARRRAQLVLGARRSGWVYLRGDRHDVADLIALQLADA